MGVTRYWDTVIAAVIAVVAGALMPMETWEKVSDDLVVFLGIQVAAVLPTMIFTAGILRAPGLSVAEFQRYQSALMSQMRFWGVLVFLDFASAILVIVGKAIDWKAALLTPVNGPWTDPARWYSGVGALLVTLAILRTIPFVRGVRSLLELNGEMVKGEIIRRQPVGPVEYLPPGPEIEKPEGHGKIVH